MCSKEDGAVVGWQAYEQSRHGKPQKKHSMSGGPAEFVLVSAADETKDSSRTARVQAPPSAVAPTGSAASSVGPPVGEQSGNADDCECPAYAVVVCSSTQASPLDFHV